LAACRLHGAKLIIARLDRLSRDAHFLLGLDKAGVDFVAADMPNANRLTVGVMALVAEDVRKQIKRHYQGCTAWAATVPAPSFPGSACTLCSSHPAACRRARTHQGPTGERR
jgi:resolvase-like protein